MKSALIAILMLGVGAWAQKPCAGGAPPKNAPDCIPAVQVYAGPYKIVAGQIIHDDTKPLKCQKYQHVRTWTECEQGQICQIGKPEHTITGSDCVDTVHSVSEREWQELMEKIRWIDRIRAQQCPSLSWVGTKCLPFCDEVTGTQSCAYRTKPK